MAILNSPITAHSSWVIPRDFVTERLERATYEDVFARTEMELWRFHPSQSGANFDPLNYGAPISDDVAARALEHYEWYRDRQIQMTIALQDLALNEIKEGPHQELSPKLFVARCQLLTGQAAFNAGYPKSLRAAGWSIPILGSIVSDDGWGGQVKEEFLYPYRRLYEYLSERYGSRALR